MVNCIIQKVHGTIILRHNSLPIDGLYQGMYDSYIDVIGDKMNVVYFTDPTEFDYKFHSIANISFKVFHAIRNPFNNIDTMYMNILHFSIIKL